MNLETYLQKLLEKCNTIRSLYHLFYESPTIYHGSWLYYLSKRNHIDAREQFPVPESIYKNYENIELENLPPRRLAEIKAIEKYLKREYKEAIESIDWDNSSDIEIINKLNELELYDKIPEGTTDWIFQWYGPPMWAEEDSFRYELKSEFATEIAFYAPLKEWEKCKLLDDLALLDRHCLKHGILGHGDLMSHEFNVIDSFLIEEKDEIALVDRTYESYLQAAKAEFLDPSKVRLYKSPLPEDTALIQGLTIPAYGNNEDEPWIEVRQDLRHYKNQAFWDGLSSEHQAMGKLRFKNVVRPVMFKDIGEDEFHTTIKPQFITGLYDENRLALIRRIKIYTGENVKVIHLPPAGAYDIPVSETMKVELQSMFDHPLVEVVNKSYIEIVEKSIIDTIEEPILEVMEIPAVQFFQKRFTELLPSIKVLPHTDIEVIHEPLLKGNVESTSLFKDMVLDQYQKIDKIGNSPIKKLNLPEDVVSVKPVCIPGWNGGAFVPPPPIFLTMPFLQALGRVLILEAKRMIIQMILRILLRILLTIAISLLIRLLKMIKDKVQAIVKSIKEDN